MNRCFLLGKITNISEYKFYFNSKKHNANISFYMYTLENEFSKKQLIRLQAYDEVADFFYRNCENEDIVFIEGRLMKDMNVEVLYCLNVVKNSSKKLKD